MNQRDHYLQEKSKQVIGLIKKELGGKIITQFATLSPKTYSYLKYDNNENKKQKTQNKSVII